MPVRARPRRPITRPVGGRGSRARPPSAALIAARAAAAQQAPPTPGQGAAGDGGVDFSADPILAQIRALAAANIATSEGSAADQRRQALLNFGYAPGLDYGGADIQQAAANNPFSVLAQLQHTHEGRVRGMGENLARANLSYSSTHGVQAGEEARGYLGEQTAAQGALQNLLGTIGSNLAQSRQSEQERIIQAEEDAYTRALDQALQYGYGTSSGAAAGSGTHTARGSRALPIPRPRRRAGASPASSVLAQIRRRRRP